MNIQPMTQDACKALNAILEHSQFVSAQLMAVMRDEENKAEPNHAALRVMAEAGWLLCAHRKFWRDPQDLVDYCEARKGRWPHDQP